MYKKTKITLLCLLVMVLILSCGRKGPILPPLNKAPQPAKNLAFKQTGDRLRISWEPPETTMGGMPLDSDAFVEIYLAFYPIDREEPPSQEEQGAEPASGDKKTSTESGLPPDFVFEKESYLLAVVKRSPAGEGEELSFPSGLPDWFDLKLDKPDYFSKGLAFAILVRDGRKRKSPRSELFFFRPKALPVPPGNLNFFVREEAVTIVWDPPAENIDGTTTVEVGGYNLYRSSEDEEFRKLNEKPLKEARFVDKSFVFGSTYLYMVKTLPKADSGLYESEFSHALQVLVEDTFPPAAPQGLDFIAGGEMISLSWQGGAERDLSGYRIYRRRAGSAEFIALTPEPVKENAYNDTSARRGIRYEYVVTAVDRAGNESDRSSIIRAELR